MTTPCTIILFITDTMCMLVMTFLEPSAMTLALTGWCILLVDQLR